MNIKHKGKSWIHLSPSSPRLYSVLKYQHFVAGNLIKIKYESAERVDDLHTHDLRVLIVLYFTGFLLLFFFFLPFFCVCVGDFRWISNIGSHLCLDPLFRFC